MSKARHRFCALAPHALSAQPAPSSLPATSAQPQRLRQLCPRGLRIPPGNPQQTSSNHRNAIQSPYPVAASAADASGFLLVSLSKTPRPVSIVLSRSCRRQACSESPARPARPRPRRWCKARCRSLPGPRESVRRQSPLAQGVMTCPHSRTNQNVSSGGWLRTPQFKVCVKRADWETADPRVCTSPAGIDDPTGA